MSDKDNKMDKNRFDKKYPLLNCLICYKGNEFNRYYDTHPDEEKALLHHHRDFINSKKRAFPEIATYFNDRLHDSTVLNTELTGQSFHLYLNDCSPSCFVDIMGNLSDTTGKPNESIVPVQIVFHGLRSFSTGKLNNNRKILPVSFKKYKQHIDMFLYAEFIELNINRVVLGIVFSLAKPPYTMLIEIDCSKIDILEQQN